MLNLFYIVNNINNILWRNILKKMAINCQTKTFNFLLTYHYSWLHTYIFLNSISFPFFLFLKTVYMSYYTYIFRSPLLHVYLLIIIYRLIGVGDSHLIQPTFLFWSNYKDFIVHIFPAKHPCRICFFLLVLVRMPSTLCSWLGLVAF